MEDYLERYTHLKKINGRGLCGVSRFIYTVAMVYGIDENGYTGRYCYASKQEAVGALEAWTGEGHPGGAWIKHKGHLIDESNPNKHIS